MSRCSWILLWVFPVLLLACTRENVDLPPIAKTVPSESNKHGLSRIDHYQWLEDREDPDVLTYLGAENAYAEAIMASTNDLRDRLLQEITSRVEETDLSVPDRIGDDFYYTRWEEGQEHPIYARRRGSMDAPEQVLLDVNRLAADGAPIRVRPPIVSPGQDVLAFHVHFMDQPPEHNVFRFKNLDSGELFEDEIPGPTLGWSGAWGNDDRTFFYVRLDPGTDPWQVRRHVLGTDPAGDEIVHAEQDLDSQCLISRTRSGRYLVITSYASGFGADLEERLLDADRPTDRFELFLPQAEGHVSDLEHGGDHFFFRFSDQTGDPQIFRTPMGRWDIRHWEEVISERDDATIERYWLYREHMVVVEKKHGLLRFLVHSLDDGQEHYIDFGEPAYQVYGDPLEFGSRLHRYTYSSPSTPMSVYTYDMETRETVLVDQERVGPDYDPKDYVTERLYAPARDGVLVPVSIVYRRGTEKNGNNPLLLDGYGAAGVDMFPSFSARRLSLLDRGFVYAIAHVRGGGENGEVWHDAGRLLNKTNTFTDFIDVAEYLISEGYTGPHRLFARGESAGGLLIGAVINLRPDLFKGVIAKVPFVDPITWMLGEESGETYEGGDPEDEEYFRYVLSYAPYDNVAAQDYPNILVTNGIFDDNVGFWAPPKWVAKLRATRTDDNLILLKTDMLSGHAGSLGRYDRWQDLAFEFAFLLKLAGIER